MEIQLFTEVEMNSRNSTLLITSEFTNQRARKALFTCAGINLNNLLFLKGA